MNSYANSLLSGLNYGFNQPQTPINYSAFQNAFQPTPTQTGNDQLVGVNGFESAKAYPTKPNSTYVLFDTNRDMFYIKNTDASNFPTLKAYSFKEVSNPEETANDEKYVTVEEFRKFKKEILNGKQSISKSTRSKWGNREHSTNKEPYANGSEQRESTSNASVFDADESSNS